MRPSFRTARSRPPAEASASNTAVPVPEVR